MKKISLASIPFLALTFLVSCNSTTEYKVSIPDTNGVIVTPNKVAKDKDYVGTIKMAQDVDPDHVLPAALDKVTSGNKELKVSDYTYTLKEDKLSADFKIPAANIVGDVDIYLSPVLKDPYKVTEDEFNDAISFKGVQYMQASMNDASAYLGVESKQTKNYEFSPNKAHTTEIDEKPLENYHEVYSVKLDIGQTYNLSRSSKDEQWGEWQSAEHSLPEKLPTPEDLGGVIVKTLQAKELTYQSFEYKDGSYIYSFDDQLTGKGTLTLSFENKKLVAYSNVFSAEMEIMGKVIKVEGDTKYTYTYNKIEIELPKNPPATYTITMPKGTKITPNTFVHGENFMGIIEVTEEGKSLPEDIGETDYFYLADPGRKSATLSIPTTHTTQDITLELKLKETSNTVEEEAFNKAISFTDIVNAQSQTSISYVNPTVKDSYSDSSTITGKTSSEFYKGLAHLINDTTEAGKSNYAETYYAEKDGEYHWELTRTSADEDWDTKEWQSVEGLLPTPQSELSAGINDQFKKFGISPTFNQFKYDSTSKSYTTEGKAKEYGQAMLISIKFENDVIFGFSVESTDKTSYVLTTTYSYKNEMPIPPKPIY